MSQTALLVVDVQSALVAAVDHGAEILSVIPQLIARARTAGHAGALSAALPRDIPTNDEGSGGLVHSCRRGAEAR